MQKFLIIATVLLSALPALAESEDCEHIWDDWPGHFERVAKMIESKDSDGLARHAAWLRRTAQCESDTIDRSPSPYVLLYGRKNGGEVWPAVPGEICVGSDCYVRFSDGNQCSDHVVKWKDKASKKSIYEVTCLDMSMLPVTVKPIIKQR